MLQSIALVPSGVKHVTVAVNWIVYQREVTENYIERLSSANHISKHRFDD